jgi:uncharacterized protein YcsI (UPF0317 family)
METGIEVRLAARRGEWLGPTPGLAPGFVQANLVVLPHDWAYDFLLFCQRNPKPCPLLDVTETGNPVPKYVAPNSDIRTDLPRYRVYRHGQLVEQRTEILDLWTNDLVGFLIGCSFTFESALQAAGIPVRHIEQNRNVPMYRTNINCRPAGRFAGPLVVSMRPMTPGQAIRATEICSRFPRAHGTPVHWGDPREIGIEDLAQPDFGNAVAMGEGEIPVFWACGVTPQAAILRARPPIAITHEPGHMFVTDLREHDLQD